MALLVWSLALRLTGDRRVAAVATLLACLGGGMGWLRLVGDVIAGDADIVGLITQNPYDNSWADGWPFFRIASVLGTAFLPHRASTLGLPGLVAAVLLVVHCLGRRPAGVLVAGLIAALLAPFHFYAFPATYVIVGLYVLTTGAWRAPTARRDAALFLGPLVLAVPFVADAIAQQGRIGNLRFVAGWTEARFGDGPLAVLFFYATNLGHPVRARARRRVHGPRTPEPSLPRRLAGRPVPRPQRRRPERRRFRHEQVLPDDVDRGRDPGRLADPAMAEAGHRGGGRARRPSHPGSSPCGMPRARRSR